MANNDYITTDCKLTVSKNTAKLDEEIFLYKNDRNIKLLIEIVDNKYRYKSDDLSNLLSKYKASYAQVKWYKNAEVKKEFPIQPTDDGKVVFIIEGELINEDTELGDYDLQLRLLNENQESIRSLPIIKGAVHILKPLFEDGDIATVNSAVADRSMLSLDGAPINTYNSDGTYNQTNWGNGDIISSAKLNKLEKVSKDNVDKVNKIPAKSIVEGGKIYLAKEDGTKLDSGTELPAGGTGTSYDDTAIKADIQTLKANEINLIEDETSMEGIKDNEYPTLTTTDKTLIGGINEVNAQCKDVVTNKADKKTTESIQTQVNNLVLGAVGDGNNAEVVQARGEYSTLNDRLNAEDKFKSVTKYGTTNLSIDRFTMEVGAKMGTSLTPILSSGVVSVTVVAMGSTVKIQHIRYDKTSNTMKVINTKEATGLTRKTICTIPCDFDFEIDGNDYVACTNVGYSTNSADVDHINGYKFLIGTINDVSYTIDNFNTNKAAIIGVCVNVSAITAVAKTNERITKNANNINELEFEINNLQNRCNKLERLNTFAWNDFDKSYFALVFDDGNVTLYDFYALAHSKGIPILSACPSNGLNLIKDKVTMPTLLKNIELDGGEILAHYFGSPTDESTDADWIEYTRNQKKALQDAGLTVRGIIRADATQANSKKGEKYCKMYFDYADSMGTSPQYNLGTRKFLIGVQTLDDMKGWIDECCTKPGFYPICIHGLRDDEPLATVDNLTAIIDYIQSKNNTEFTTYSKMFDTFGTTKLEKRLLALENKNK